MQKIQSALEAGDGPPRQGPSCVCSPVLSGVVHLPLEVQRVWRAAACQGSRVWRAAACQGSPSLTPHRAPVCVSVCVRATRLIPLRELQAVVARCMAAVVGLAVATPTPFPRVPPHPKGPPWTGTAALERGTLVALRPQPRPPSCGRRRTFTLAK
jgi:hypothetical protein